MNYRYLNVEHVPMKSGWRLRHTFEDFLKYGVVMHECIPCLLFNCFVFQSVAIGIRYLSLISFIKHVLGSQINDNATSNEALQA